VAVGALGDDRRPIALIVVEGATTRDVLTVVEATLAATAGAAAAFVASSGHGAEVPGEALFGAVERRCDQAGATLLEWFVPVGGDWIAVGQARGRAWRW
jgi:hypothetical protein